MISELKVLQFIDFNQVEKLIESRYEELRINLKDEKFCSLLLNLYHNPFQSNLEEFDVVDLKTIDHYIRITHAYYINTKLPEIEQCLNHLSFFCSEDHHLISRLQHFFQAYSHQLESHIRMEEKGILRLSEAKINGKKINSNQINNFVDEHDDIDSILLEVQDVLHQLEENNTQLSLLKLLSHHLEILQLDLFIHGMIEEKVFLKKLRN